ncbi:hypothetical protein BO70DRAFT_283958 [Aspergillus heteromorphus CBS 117.55]|uniref:DUF7702 domain-containing protein n=1 Tax=Aspergillus heteromorphus CBS 117.55 TaxID=1448321 RepID=A0A317X1C2_9EURO|nr:uncharacterized protein BO70DRAFT_283958 [Aspergillus heteromorphus CBS 117.55]PWY90748.1 hypothetical protein BO70DRAFT_283958 [Aspergillus heteromorphus CBS 117.55]
MAKLQSVFTIPRERRYIAIAEIVIFSVIQTVQFIMKFMQEWRYWHHNKRKSYARCFLYSWFGLLGILAQLRIAGSAMVIANSRPGQSLLIAESVLQSVGLSPLLFEVSLVLLRSGQSGRSGPGNSRYPKHIRILLHAFRFPVIISIILVVVGGIIGIRACRDTGAAVFVATFAFVCSLIGWLAVRFRPVLPAGGYHCVLVVLMTLPFFAVRIAYFLLGHYGSQKFSPVTGSRGVMVGMSLVMEIFIVILLLLARAVAEPFLPAGEIENDSVA